MLIALAILCLLFFLYRISSERSVLITNFSRKWICFGLLVLLVQIILGTQVRESVDILLHIIPRDQITHKLPIVFELHRTMAWLIVISNSFILFYNRKFFKKEIEQKLIILILFCLLISGITMSYFSIIGSAQFVHLLGAISLFICQFSMLLRRFRLPILRSL